MNTSAQKLNRTDLINKFKTLSQGQIGESVLDKMAMTFAALVKLADFDTPPSRNTSAEFQYDEEDFEDLQGEHENESDVRPRGRKINLKRPLGNLGGLHYNIQIILPESRDPAVYDV